MARQAQVALAAFMMAGAALLSGAGPAAAQSSPSFVENAQPLESVPQYLRQLAGRDFDDLLLADGVAAQSGWVAGKSAYYLTYHGAERSPDWLALSVANAADQKAPVRLGDIFATLLSVPDRSAFLRNYDDRLAAPGPWRLCMARGGRQVLIHNRGSATFVSFARRVLSADLDCPELGRE
ncbi:MAG TPA: hypothetical protein VMV26_14330 [Alphaproteobacteria bacterium]|nr:hypothetical protein [Alphaproteobacteria bacterium]